MTFAVPGAALVSRLVCSARRSRLLVGVLLAAIVLAGCSLRLTAVTQTVFDKPLRGDAWKYYCTALNIQRWQVFSHQVPGEAPPVADSYLPPGYPALLATLVEYPPGERMLMHIGLVQVAIGCMTLVLVYLLFAGMSGRGIGLVAATLAALSPHLVSLTSHVLTETLFTLVLLAGIWLTAAAVGRDRLVLALLGGALIGSSALVRSTTEYLLVFLLPALLIGSGWRARLGCVAATAAGCIAAIGAWKLRNLLVTGFASDPTLALSAMHFGIYPDFMHAGIPASLGVPARFDPHAADVSRSLGSVITEVQSRFSAEPLRYARWYLVDKPLALFAWDNRVGGSRDVFIYPVITSPYLHNAVFVITHAIMRAVHGPLVLLALAGCAATSAGVGLAVFGRSACIQARILCALVLYFLAVHIVGFPLPRYGIPLLPVVYGYGVFTACALVARLARACRESGAPLRCY